MKYILTYTHTRNLFIKNEFKPFVKKYFKDVRFVGTECGKFDAAIEVSNYEDVKDSLPKYAIPDKAEFLINNRDHINIIEWLSFGSMGIAIRRAEYCNENHQNGN